jgi:hypothetical protein
VIGEQHLRHILMCYMEYYNAVRTHLSLAKDAPVRRLIQRTGRIQVRARSWRATPSIRTDLIFGRDRRHCRHSDLGWAASPIRPDIIFGKDRQRAQSRRFQLRRPRFPLLKVLAPLKRS